jgi:hypothetical protein
MVDDAWEDWNTDRRRAAIKAVINAVIVRPADNRALAVRDRESKFQTVRDRTDFDWRF